MNTPTLADKRAEVARLHEGLKSWRLVAEHYPGAKPGTLSRFVNDNAYVPHRATVLTALGLPVFDKPKVCPRHGIVHVAKRCPATRKPGKPRLPRLDRYRLALELIGVLNG